MIIKEILIKSYGIDPYLITKQGNVFKVQTRDRNYAFKVYDWPVHSDFHIYLQQQLRENGFFHIPQVIPTLEGSLSVKQGGMTYILNEWIEGLRPSFLNVEQLKTASAFLASFHLAATGLEQANIKNLSNDFLFPSTFREIRVGQYRNDVIFDKLKEWVERFGTDPLGIALERMEYAEYLFPNDGYTKLVAMEKKENTFIHGDYNSSNLIFTPKGELYLLDFDDSSYFVRISDLIFLCHLHMGGNGEKLLDILRSYHNVRPLSFTEFEIVKSQLFVPGKIYWEMHIQTYLNNPIDKDWITRNLARYSSKESFDTIKQLSYSDLI